MLELRVTPTITNDNRVFLNMQVKKDEVDRLIELQGYGTVPSINRREVNTAVLVEDGQTVVIGGVYEFTDRSSISKVPFLGDVPFLGNLFKARPQQGQGRAAGVRHAEGAARGQAELSPRHPRNAEGPPCAALLRFHSVDPRHAWIAQ